MPIVIKSARDIELMREACRITAGARTIARQGIRDGITTHELDREIRRYIVKNGAEPTFYHYAGFPGNACISINEEVIHGIPGRQRHPQRRHRQRGRRREDPRLYRRLRGDLPLRRDQREAEDLIAVTRQSFFEGIKFARPGYRISDIGHAIQEYVESHGYSVVRAYVGHGVGAELHEEPEVPNYGEPGHGPRLVKGMTLAIEPMVNAGTYDIRVLDNDWTVVTADGKLSAHYENTILITDGEPEILTMAEDI